MRHRVHEVIFLLAAAFAVFLLISLLSYHVSDPGWSTTGLGTDVVNWGGRVGAWFSDILLSLFGIVAYLFPLLIILSSWVGIKEERAATQKKSHEFSLN